MALQYSLYGGATRPDAISGLNPRLAAALERLYAEAPPEVQRELGLNSAYRSKEVQQALWDKSDKTGRTVAAPGKSRHNSGEAVDLFGFGLKGGGQVSQATKDWVGANLGKYGLVRPMDYEPWHLQLADAGKAPQQGPQAGWTPEQIQKAFLDTIAGPEGGGAYDIMYGGNKFTDFSRHPHTPQTAGGITSDVAGRYQFKGSTWDELQGKYGYKDFSQANQDAAAWQYARDIYKQKSGGDLVEALQSGDPARINAASQVLNQTWTSLPGGKEQSKGYGNKTFYDVYSGHLGPGGVAPAIDTSGAGATVAAATGNQFALPQTAKERPKNFLQRFAENIQDVAAAPDAPRPQVAMQPPPVAAITADKPVAPVAAIGSQDPARRQQLAQLLAQLNSGKLTL